MSRSRNSRSRSHESAIAGPMNNNLFLEEGQNIPAWRSDLPLEPNPGLRGGPYATIFMDHPPCTIPLREPSPDPEQVVHYITTSHVMHSSPALIATSMFK
ncbi:hypothetical protein F4818DRAFT_436863 [Hypoxylon cercidicola]|nr:hypothetical protein F4818DRAFT_436863 [Hypoxylon cercidicola]